MRKFLSIFLVLLGIFASAQFRSKTKQQNRVDSDNQDFSYGYYLGVNIFDFKLHPNDGGLTQSNRFTVYTEPKMGFHAGLIGKWRLNRNFDFKAEPGIFFVQRDLIFQHVIPLIGSQKPNGGEFIAADSIRSLKSTYLDIPIFINLHGDRWGNTRPFMQTGIGWSVNLQSNEKKIDDNDKGVFRSKTHNFNWQFEMGVDIYFKRFKLTPAVKGIFFFNNEWVPDNEDSAPVWANSLTALSTRAFVFSLKFE